MSNILLVTSSAAGDKSQSRALALEFAEKLRARHPDANIVERPVTPANMPHFSMAMMTGGKKTPDQRTEEETAAIMLSDTLCKEVLDADTLVIAAPMYTLTIPSTLKAWLEYINRTGLTYKVEGGKIVGLLGGKRVVLVCTRGSDFSGELAHLDHQTTFLQAIFGFFGVTDISTIVADAVIHDPDAAMASARAQLETIAAQ